MKMGKITLRSALKCLTRTEVTAMKTEKKNLRRISIVVTAILMGAWPEKRKCEENDDG